VNYLSTLNPELLHLVSRITEMLSKNMGGIVSSITNEFEFELKVKYLRKRLRECLRRREHDCYSNYYRALDKIKKEELTRLIHFFEDLIILIERILDCKREHCSEVKMSNDVLFTSTFRCNDKVFTLLMIRTKPHNYKLIMRLKGNNVKSLKYSKILYRIL